MIIEYLLFDKLNLFEFELNVTYWTFVSER